MKKVLLISAITCLTYFVNGQELGLRFGNVTSADNNVAIDGVFSLGEFNRIHADVSFGHGVGIDALYDFAYYPFPNVANLNWYGGVGAFMYIHDPFWFGGVGEIGLEYKFTEIPLNVGLDWRPYLSLIQEVDFYGGGFGLNIRYDFGRAK
jgi:hypothetical protein